MNPAPLPPELLATAPAISARLGEILRALAALIAHAFLKDPRHVAVIVPLWNYIGRTSRRFDRLMARLAVGTLRPAKPRPDRATVRPASAAPTSAALAGRSHLRLPATRGWLLVALRHHAACYGLQIVNLLDQPETARLLAAAPQAGRVLRPLCRMLGIAPAALQPPPRPAREVRAPAPQPARAAEPDPPAETPRKLYPPPCPHVRWPWFPTPRAHTPAQPRAPTLNRLRCAPA